MSEINFLINQIKQSTDFQINKRILKEKITTDLHIPYNNGLFKVSMDLIAFLNSWEETELYLEDIYQNPIKVDRIEFLNLCKQQYYKVFNYWHMEHERNKQIREI